MEILASFGINGKLLLAQIFNFFILLLILYWLAYKPIVKILDGRAKKIKESLETAEKIKQEDIALEVRKQEIVAEAKKEALKIIQEAKMDGEKARDEALKRASEEAQKIIDKAKISIEAEREALLQDVKKEISDLVVAVSSRVLSKEIDKETENKLIKSVTKDARGLNEDC